MSAPDDQDERFERTLLASARCDGPEADVEDAWTRFAAAVSTLAPATDHVQAPPPARPGIGRLAAVKWLALGAAGGASLTAAVMLARTPVRSSPPAVSRAAVAPVVSTATPRPRGQAPAQALEDPPAAREARPAGHPRPAGVRVAGTARPPEAVPPPGSVLAAEVARIDTARAVSAMGDHDEAIRLIERYHREFPEGMLAPDADVVALEACAAKGDAAGTARRAGLFLTRYPDDPHAPRVRLLLAGHN
jgi:TolA-binding protein